MKRPQKDIVRDRILLVGYVDNFWSVENKVSLRLSEAIRVLKREGWDFHGEYRETSGSDKNWHYFPTKIPQEYKEKMKTPLGLFTGAQASRSSGYGSSELA